MSAHPETIIKEFCGLCLKEITGKVVKNHSEEFKNLHFNCYLRLKRKLTNFRRGLREKEQWGA